MWRSSCNMCSQNRGRARNVCICERNYPSNHTCCILYSHNFRRCVQARQHWIDCLRASTSRTQKICARPCSAKTIKNRIALAFDLELFLAGHQLFAVVARSRHVAASLKTYNNTPRSMGVITSIFIPPHCVVRRERFHVIFVGMFTCVGRRPINLIQRDCKFIMSSR